MTNSVLITPGIYFYFNQIIQNSILLNKQKIDRRFAYHNHWLQIVAQTIN